MKAFLLEIYKCRRKRLWLIAVGMVAVQGLWLLWAQRSATGAARAQGYIGCLYQFPMLNAIVLPVLIAVLVSRICDMEHRGSTMKLLLTMERPSAFFMAKLACAALHLALAVLLQLGVIYAVGRLYGFGDALPLGDCALYFLTQWLTSVFVALVVQGLALGSANLFLPLVVGLVLGFLGLMSMFFPPWVMRLVPSSYYGLLSTVHMDWNEATRAVSYSYVPFAAPEFLLLLTTTVALCSFETIRFSKREV